MVSSTTEPNWFWLRKIENNKICLRLHWDIKEKQIENPNGNNHFEYEYEEKELIIPLKSDMSVNQFKEYLKKDKVRLLKLAKIEEEPKPPIKEDIRNIDITELREKIKGIE